MSHSNILFLVAWGGGGGVLESCVLVIQDKYSGTSGYLTCNNML